MVVLSCLSTIISSTSRNSSTQQNGHAMLPESLWAAACQQGIVADINNSLHTRWSWAESY
jgi:hypothetical protein